MEKPRQSRAGLWNISFGFFGIQIGFALQNANMSRIFQSLGEDIEKLPGLWVAAPLTGLLIQPVIGHMSDRTWLGRLGRRRPYFLAGAILAAIALFGAPIEHPTATPPPSLAFALKGLLAAPYGAITEEVMLRAFVMGLAAWLLSRFSGRQPRSWVMLAAIILAALVFGLGHLPAAARLAPLTADLVMRVIGYNALGGFVFGWLYWRRGLEHAMLAHFAADVVLHVLSPLLAG